MARGRKWYPKVKVACGCGWNGKRTKYMTSKPCPRCAGRPKEVKSLYDIAEEEITHLEIALIEAGWKKDDAARIGTAARVRLDQIA